MASRSGHSGRDCSLYEAAPGIWALSRGDADADADAIIGISVSLPIAVSEASCRSGETLLPIMVTAFLYWHLPPYRRAIAVLLPGHLRLKLRNLRDSGDLVYL